MRVLVTGGTGLLGNNIVRAVLARGDSVRVLVRQQGAEKFFAGLDVEQLEGDVRDASSVAAACQGVDLVLHSAAWVHVGWRKGRQMHDINVEGTENLARSALEAGVRLVHVSSVDTLGVGSPSTIADERSPRSGKIPCPYVLTKRAAEQRLHTLIQNGLDAVIVNPGLMFGPWDWKPSSGKLVVSVLRQRPPMAPRGGCSACDARDVAAGVLAAARHGVCGQNYILGGENMRFLDLFRKIANLKGRPGAWCRMPSAMAWSVGFCGDAWARMTGTEGAVNSASIGMGGLFNYYSSEKARRDLGYTIRPIEETLRDSYEWFREFGYLDG